MPISSYRKEITSTLESSQVLVLSGETGWYAQTSALDLMLSPGKWEIYTSSFFHLGGSTVPREALQDLLHRTTPYFSDIISPKSLTRARRPAWSSGWQWFLDRLLDQIGKQYLEEHKTRLRDERYCASNAGRRNRSGRSGNGL